MRASLALAITLASFGSPSRAQTAADLEAHRFLVDPQHSTVAFTSTIRGGIHVRGRFTAYDATILFDPTYADRSSVTAVIQVASLNTDMAFRDNHLRSPDFFDAKQFPTIVFTSDQVRPTAGGALISGSLTMHGVTRHVVLPAKLVLAPEANESGNVFAEFTAELKIDRRDYGIANTNVFNPSYNPLTTMLSDSVDILLELDANHVTYASRRLGNGGPPGVADTINRVIKARGVAAGLETYRALRATRASDFSFSAGQLDVIAHQLSERGAARDAVKVAQFNAELFADTPGVLESLGEVLAVANEGPAALDAYRRALSKFPDSSESREMVRRLEAVTHK